MAVLINVERAVEAIEAATRAVDDNALLTLAAGQLAIVLAQEAGPSVVGPEVGVRQATSIADRLKDHYDGTGHADVAIREVLHPAERAQFTAASIITGLNFLRASEVASRAAMSPAAIRG